ncbi:MAG: hypothetical protein KKB51_24550 [Candidatus Riflebacteria bacterium]|nr:hypothetical protein [Candidatus Riflebacteria bacterium]
MTKVRIKLLLFAMIIAILVTIYSFWQLPSYSSVAPDEEFKIVVRRNEPLIAEDLAFFANNADSFQKIHVIEGISDQKFFAVKDPATIKKIVGAVSLEPKPECACAHFDEVEFFTKDTSRTFVYCDHCFDSCQTMSWQTYHMNPELYELLTAITDENGSGSSDIR